LTGSLHAASASTAQDPLAVVAPCVTLSAGERQRLERGELVSRTLPGASTQVALFAVTRIEAPPRALADATRSIADLKRSSFVLGVQRFSQPPVLSDLDSLVLPDRDLQALRDCETGDCDLKLTTPEIQAIRAVGSRPSDAALQQAFRRVVLDRVTTYLAGGLAGVPPVANRSRVFPLAPTMSALQDASPCVLQAPPLASWLRNYPAGGRDVESFLYWSQEVYRAGRPVVLATHVAILEDATRAIVVGKQILSTRYMDGGIAMTAITTDPATGRRYLVYLNRSSVDLLDGFWGGLVRRIVESKVRGEVPEIIDKLRQRLERQPS
jgi:hypothetical protein